MTKMKGKLRGRLMRKIWNSNRKMSKRKTCNRVRSK